MESFWLYYPRLMSLILLILLAFCLASCDDEPRARHHLRPAISDPVEPVASPPSHDEIEADVDRQRAERRAAYFRSQDELRKKLSICRGC
jgi:hypothetical protein